MLPLTNGIRILLFLFLVCGGLYFARPFLVPVVLSALLAMLLAPLCIWLEHKGWHKVLAAVACVLLLLAAVSGIIALLSWQVAGIAGDADQAMEQVNAMSARIQEYIHQKVGIPLDKQETMIREKSMGLTSKAGTGIALLAGGILGLLANTLLVMIYTFLFIYFRTHLQAFALRLADEEHKKRLQTILSSGSRVAQQYVTGMGLMIVTLWVMYGIGFSIVGVKHAIFFAVLCGLLEIVPYIGNLTGCLLTALMVFAQGNSSLVPWVFLVYGIVQFTQTYLLEPLVVGARVSINPLCTIMVIVLGELVWGVPGMILAIPMLGIFKIICDNVPSMQPLGFLIGEVKETRKKRKGS